MIARQQIHYGGRTIPFTLQRNARKRLRIEVMPDSRVVVLAPNSTATDLILRTVQGKGGWIARQQRYFRQFEPRTTAREFVSGETHLYLGKRYRLRVYAVHGTEGVKLSGPYLKLFCRDASDAGSKRSLLEAWYRGHAERVFTEVVDAVIKQKAFRGLARPDVSVRAMKRRWGSCTSRGRILLNTRLVRAPRGCIEYVVAHELSHLIFPNHSPDFERLLKRVMPDWNVRKALLEAKLA
jgi:predicted metal-dependent hydrolase